MQISIGDALEPVERVTFREMGFGQPAAGKELLKIVIDLTVNDLLDAVSEAFDQFAKESKEDDDRFGDLMVEPLRTLGYPTLRQALDSDRRAVANILLNYLFLELLDGLFGQNELSQCTYAVNSLESIKIEGDNLVVAGRAYELS